MWRREVYSSRRRRRRSAGERPMMAASRSQSRSREAHARSQRTTLSQDAIGIVLVVARPPRRHPSRSRSPALGLQASKLLRPAHRCHPHPRHLLLRKTTYRLFQPPAAQAEIFQTLEVPARINVTHLILLQLDPCLVSLVNSLDNCNP